MPPTAGPGSTWASAAGLSPLLQRDRRRIELMNGLAVIDAGHARDLLRRRDRHGRQHLHRRPRRRAHADAVVDRPQWRGFSRADPAKLVLPPIMDPIYGFQAVNVEAQASDPHSVLNWMRRMLAVRQRHKAFGRGTQRFLYPGNRKVLAYLREYRPGRWHRRDDPVRLQPVALSPGGGTGPVGLCRARAGGCRRRVRVPRYRPTSVSAHPAPLCLLLVPACIGRADAGLAYPPARGPARVLHHRAPLLAGGSAPRLRPHRPGKRGAAAVPAETALVRLQDGDTDRRARGLLRHGEPGARADLHHRDRGGPGRSHRTLRPADGRGVGGRGDRQPPGPARHGARAAWRPCRLPDGRVRHRRVHPRRVAEPAGRRVGGDRGRRCAGVPPDLADGRSWTWRRTPGSAACPPSSPTRR